MPKKYQRMSVETHPQNNGWIYLGDMEEARSEASATIVEVNTCCLEQEIIQNTLNSETKTTRKCQI